MKLYKFVILLVAYFVFPRDIFAEFFTHTFGESPDREAVYFKSVSNGYIIVGSSIDSTFHTRGYYILKLDRQGKKVWEKSYPDAFSVYTNGVAVLSNGNIAILGTHAGILYSALAEVVLLDSTGEFITSSNYPPLDGWGTSGAEILQSDDSTLAITIYTDGFVSTNYYSIYKLNSDLSTQWTEFVAYDGSLLNAHSLTKTFSNNYFSLSYYDTYYYSAQPAYQVSSIRKFNSTGSVLLDSLFEFNCTTNSIASTINNGVIIGATVNNFGQTDMKLIKLNSQGDFMWSKEFGSYLNETTTHVIQTSDGGYALLASIIDPILPNQNDILLVKTNASGDSIWSKKLGSTLNEISLHIEENTDSSLAILGSTNGFGNNHIFFVIVDQYGNIPCNYSVIAPIKYLCSSDSMVISLDPVPGPTDTVIWSTGDTTSNITVFETGNYFATIIDSTGNVIETSFAPVFFASTPNVELGTDTSGVCSNGILNNSFVGDFTVHYQWYLNDTLLPGETSTYLYPTSIGTYKLMASNYCKTDSDQIYINSIYSLPQQPTVILPPIDYVCENDSMRLLAIADSTFNLQWFFADDFNWHLLNGETDSVYYAKHNGVFFIRVTNQNGCINYSDPVTVTYDNVLPTVNAAGPSSFCEGGEVLLYSSPGTNFIWNTSDTTESITVSTPGDYYLSYIDANSCPKVTDTITITILSKPFVTLGPDTTLCNTVTYLMDAGAGFNNYLWNYGPVSQTIALFSSAQAIDTQNVIVFVTDTNGCTNSDTAMVIFDVCDNIASTGIQSEFIVYPSVLSIGECLTVKSIGKNNTLLLYDFTGRLVYKNDYSSFSYNYLNLRQGVYAYQIISDGKNQLKGKIVISN